MPELPEVETTRRGLAPLVTAHRIARLTVRERRLRWPIAKGLNGKLAGREVVALNRRGKYLLFELDRGCLLIHLGMSGSLRYLPEAVPVRTHDHFDIVLDGGALLRYNDPRRFGSLHYTTAPENHPLLRDLGPEPFADAFTGDYLWRLCRGRRTAIKTLIMNAHVVVGIGNIYANEALFRAGIHPARPAARVSRPRLDCLCGEIRAVLEDALRAGGTTLRDFVGGDGKPGYFRQSLAVYERDGQPCRNCGALILRRVLGQRASYYCPRCQR
jgi:formamidopyrimidine-DNA glycosylase